MFSTSYDALNVRIIKYDLNAVTAIECVLDIIYWLEVGWSETQDLLVNGRFEIFLASIVCKRIKRACTMLSKWRLSSIYHEWRWHLHVLIVFKIERMDASALHNTSANIYIHRKRLTERQCELFWCVCPLSKVGSILGIIISGPIINREKISAKSIEI